MYEDRRCGRIPYIQLQCERARENGERKQKLKYPPTSEPKHKVPWIPSLSSSLIDLDQEAFGLELMRIWINLFVSQHLPIKYQIPQIAKDMK